jgi:hypothetical protein
MPKADSVSAAATVTPMNRRSVQTRDDGPLLAQMSPAERERFVKVTARWLLCSVMEDIEREENTGRRTWPTP